MVEMTIRMQIRPSKLKELLQTLDELRREKRQTKGFLDSLAFVPNGDENTLTFIEQWDTQEDLSAYLQSYYFSVLRGAMKVLTSSSEITFTSTTGDHPGKVLSGNGRETHRGRDHEKTSQHTHPLA